MYLNPVFEAPEMVYCINKTQIKALVCADKFKQRDYYEFLLTIAPELVNCARGNLQSEKVPSLKTVIRISETNKRYFLTMRDFQLIVNFSSGTYNFRQILDLANDSEVANVQKFQQCISPDDGCSLHFTSVTLPEV